MRKPYAILIRLAALYLMSCSQPGFAAEPMALVTHPSSNLNGLSLETVKLVYLRKLMLASDGSRWIPLNLPSTHELRRAFSFSLFKKLPEEQEAYWNEQYFQGLTPPQVLASEEAVLRFVAITPGAIGYVQKHSVDDRVKILQIIPTADPN